MLKRIDVQHLVIGMFLHEFCGSWMEHPFWRTRFLLNDPEDLRRIRESSVSEVWIDVAKGLDVADGVAVVTRAQVDAQVEADLQQAQDAPSITVTLPEHAPPQARTMAEEIREAAQLCASSKKAVMDMFQEARMGQAIDPTKAQGMVADISASIARNPEALVSLARLKTADDYTYMHSVAVAALMIALARQLGMDDRAVHIAGMAGLMHDLGKAKMPMEVLNKPGKLTDEEFAIVRTHPGHSYLMLRESDLHPQVLDACLHHHEKIDGTGYPHGLKGDEISVLARMNAICDVYDAITSNRPYKSGWDPSESLRRMAEWTQGHFDARLFQAFVKTIGIYPAGSLLRLASGRLAVVLEQSPQSRLLPKVRVFYSTKSNLRIPSEDIDLSAPGCHEKIAAREDPQQWNFPDLNTLWTGITPHATHHHPQKA